MTGPRRLCNPLCAHANRVFGHYEVYIVYGFPSGVPVLRELPPKHSLLDRLGEFLL